MGMRPNKALQRTVLPPLRSGKPAAELGRWASKRTINHYNNGNRSGGFPATCTGLAIDNHFILRRVFALW